jgi:hypothetical protein
MNKHDLKNIGSGLQSAPQVSAKVKRTLRADIIINILGGLFGALLVVLCTIVLFEGSL